MSKRRTHIMYVDLDHADGVLPLYQCLVEPHEDEYDFMWEAAAAVEAISGKQIVVDYDGEPYVLEDVHTMNINLGGGEPYMIRGTPLFRHKHTGEPLTGTDGHAMPPAVTIWSRSSAIDRIRLLLKGGERCA